MVSQSGNVPEIGMEPTRRVSEMRRFTRVFFSRGLVTFGVVIILIFIVTAIFGPLFAPYSPTKQDLSNVLLKPSKQHLLGTDYLGRDTLSRLIYGARQSIMVGVVALSIAATIGIMSGLLAGYYGSWINSIIMRIMDALMSFPMILLALLLAGLLGGGLRNVMIAIGIALIPGYARLMCGQVLSIKESDYILAGKSMGSNNWRLMLRHIVPSYLGIGITPPTPSWGSMVNDGFDYLLTNPLLSFVPGLAIMVVVFAFNMVGDGLRDALDPRLRGLL
jgi:peptide/nickel transport system permease protein